MKKTNRIKMFIDISGTIDGVRGIKTVEQKNKFAQSLKTMEQTYGAKTDITFVTSYDAFIAKRVTREIETIFDECGFGGRITSCLSGDAVVTPDGSEIEYGNMGKYSTGCGGKASVINYYTNEIEKNAADIEFLVFAGDDAMVDYGMFRAQTTGKLTNLPPKIPAVFINTNALRNSVSLGHNGEQIIDDAPLPEEYGNFKTLYAGFNAVSCEKHLSEYLKGCKLKHEPKDRAQI